jgi:hypothetical protein
LGTDARLPLLFGTEALGLSLESFVVLAIVNYQATESANRQQGGLMFDMRRFRFIEHEGNQNETVAKFGIAENICCTQRRRSILEKRENFRSLKE